MGNLYNLHYSKHFVDIYKLGIAAEGLCPTEKHFCCLSERREKWEDAFGISTG
jgi:hypothetical protein